MCFYTSAGLWKLYGVPHEPSLRRIVLVAERDDVDTEILCHNGTEHVEILVLDGGTPSQQHVNNNQREQRTPARDW